MLLLHLGIAVMLGFADIVNIYTVDRLGEKESYKVVFWFEVACAAVALVVLIFFVSIKEAKSDLTVEERNAMESNAAMRVLRGEGEDDEGRAESSVGR